MPTPAEIAALAYTGGNPGGRGMTAQDFQEQMSMHGKTVRWWKGFLAAEGTPGRERNGRIFEEQSVPDEVKIVAERTSQDVYGTEFGMMPRGSLSITYAPTWLKLARGDLLLIVEDDIPARALVERGRQTLLQYGQSANTDELPHHFVKRIEAVRVNGVTVDPARYRIAQDPRQRGIEWLTGPPANGVAYSVEWDYAPLYYFLGQQVVRTNRGVDGVLLPQTGIISQQWVA